MVQEWTDEALVEQVVLELVCVAPKAAVAGPPKLPAAPPAAPPKIGANIEQLEVSSRRLSKNFIQRLEFPRRQSRLRTQQHR